MVSQRYEIGPLNKHGIYQIYSKYNWYILIPKYCNSNLTKNQHTRNCMSCPLEYTYNIHQYPKFGAGIATTWHHTLLATLPVAFSRVFCPSADTCGLSRKEMKPGAPGEANASYWLLLGTILNTMEYHAPWHWFCPPSSTTNPFSAAGGSCDSCGRLIWVASLWHSIPSGDVGHETHSSCQVATASASSGCSSATASSCRLWTSGIYCPMPLYNEYRCNSDKGQISE